MGGHLEALTCLFFYDGDVGAWGCGDVETWGQCGVLASSRGGHLDFGGWDCVYTPLASGWQGGYTLLEQKTTYPIFENPQNGKIVSRPIAIVPIIY